MLDITKKRIVVLMNGALQVGADAYSHSSKRYWPCVFDTNQESRIHPYIPPETAQIHLSILEKKTNKKAYLNMNIPERYISLIILPEKTRRLWLLISFSWNRHLVLSPQLLRLCLCLYQLPFLNLRFQPLSNPYQLGSLKPNYIVR